MSWPGGMSLLPPCAVTPEPTSVGGCLPCQTPRSPAHDSKCLRCLIRSKHAFFVGRPGMGGPEDAACFESIGGKVSNASSLWNHIRSVLASLNGIKTSSIDEAKQYARCYAAAINATDLIVRLGDNMPVLRTPLNACSKPGRQHFHKTDVLLSRAGHLFPERILSGSVLNPWERAASQVPTLNASGLEAVAGSELTAELLAQNNTQGDFEWIAALRGKTVLVVHPFTSTISAQLGRGNVALWGGLAQKMMPSSIRFKLARAPQNIGTLREQPTWPAAFAELVRRVDEQGQFDLAVISCGGLGMLLGAHLKATNRSSMYMGGALQLWFGIIGKRWASSYMSKTNTNWTRPLIEDVPKTFFRAHAKSGDGSAYW